jgi:hypothetical protein
VLVEGIDHLADGFESVELDQSVEVVLDHRPQLEPGRLHRPHGNQATASTSSSRSGYASPATWTSVLVGGRL